MTDYSEPKILNLADLLREAERQREEARKPAPVERPWCPWPETFNAGTCDENDAWAAMRSAEEFLENSSAFSAYFNRFYVKSHRRSEGGFEFLLPDADRGAGSSILRVWVGEKGCEKVEVRRV